MRAAIVSMLAACAIATPVIACGGSGDGDESDHVEAGLSEGEREAAEREAAAEQIPEPDRIAYYQVATGSGLLGAWARAVAAGDESPHGARDADLLAARRRLDDLDAEDPALDRLVRRLRRALRRASGRDRAKAEGLVAETEAISAGLQRYVRRNPVISILLPD